MIRMVVSDLDGTLLGAKSKISEENIKAIRLLQKAGIEFVIASGRDRHSVEPFLHEHSLQCACILGNGAQYVDKDWHEISNAYLRKAILPEIIRCFEAEKQYYMIFANDGFYTGCDPYLAKRAFIERGIRKFGNTEADYRTGGRYADMPAAHLQKVTDWDRFIGEDRNILKVEGFAMTEEAVEKCQERLSAIPGTAYLSSFSDNIEVTDHLAQKGLILQKVCREKNIAENEVMVIGDGMNDLSMFTCFPTWSCAPANAVEEIRKRAAYIVADHKKNGFSEAVGIALRTLRRNMYKPIN